MLGWLWRSSKEESDSRQTSKKGVSVQLRLQDMGKTGMLITAKAEVQLQELNKHSCVREHLQLSLRMGIQDSHVSDPIPGLP